MKLQPILTTQLRKAKMMIASLISKISLCFFCETDDGKTLGDLAAITLQNFEHVTPKENDELVRAPSKKKELGAVEIVGVPRNNGKCYNLLSF